MTPAEVAIREALAAALPDEHEALDAACNPVAIRTLLSELDALRARCEAREALLAQDIHSCHPNCTRSGCVNARLTRELEEARKDAERYRWLRDRLYAADFKYGDSESPVCALVFEMPDSISVSANCDRTIDAAMSQEK